MALLSSRRLLERVLHTTLHQPLLSALAAVGALTTTYGLYHLSSFVHLHFVYRSQLGRYKDAVDPSWALVTGASDGLGRGFAEELLSWGFNVILHGRNPDKLGRVRSELLAQWPDRDIEIVVLDAMLDVEDGAKMSSVVKGLKHLNIKILINNVAGDIHPLFSSHANRTAEQNLRLMNGNFILATELTRLLLPQLIRNKPSLILNIGSGSARLPCPYMAVAAASKAFLESISHTLAAEMTAEGHPEVEVMYNLVGLCSTGSEPRPVTFLVPASRHFARSSLRLVGSSYRTVWGYWPHALQFETLFMMPKSIVEKLCIDLVRSLIKEEEVKKAKS